jgi:hypothetical protein
VLHVSVCNPLDEPVIGGAWVGQARSPACSQNESGVPIILREGLRWRWGNAPCPSSSSPASIPFLFPSPASSWSRHGCAYLTGEHVAQKLSSRNRDTRLYNRRRGVVG